MLIRRTSPPKHYKFHEVVYIYSLISNAHQIPKTFIFIQISLISNADQAHIASQKLQFSCSFLYISLISNPHQIPTTFIFVQLFVYFFNFECTSGAHQIPKITIFMQFFIYFFDFQCSSDTKNFHFRAVCYISY